jgi:predicted O-methyltransferase YrrM
MRAHLAPGSRLYRIVPPSLQRAFDKWAVPPDIRRVFPVPDAVAHEIADVNQHLNTLPGGWCPLVKQHILAHLVIANQGRRAVEIGVFQGGSLFPLAAAMRVTGGLVTGIDPYSSAAAEQHDNRERVDVLIGSDSHLRVPWDDLYSRVLRELELRGLNGHARVLRMRSADAAHAVASGLDLLHVDGNHDYDAVAEDLTNYLPKLRPGGLLVLDDTDWDTVWRHVEILRERFPIVYQHADAGAVRPNWIVFRRTA